MILVNIEDVPKSSHVEIVCECDNCHKQQSLPYCSWNQRKNSELGDLCKECSIKIKFPISMEEKYGYSNCANIPFVVEKKKETNLKKYGNEWVIASDSVRKNIITTMYSKYNTDNPMKNIDIKNKAKATNQKRYGGFSPMCDLQVKNKSIETCLKKYGVKNAFQSKEIQEKARKTLYKNGKTPSSKPEKEMCKMLKELFGEENCFPNYPEGNLSLDCLVIINKCKIDFEYDGYYWHKNRKQYDAGRNAVLLNNGYKIIRINSNDKNDLPTKEQIQESVNDLITDKHNLIFINMN